MELKKYKCRRKQKEAAGRMKEAKISHVNETFISRIVKYFIATFSSKSN